jgi:hypothetical protein
MGPLLSAEYKHLHDEPFSIVARYETAFRGLADYYRLAADLHRLRRLRWIMERSLTMTLAGKFRTSVRQVYRRYRTRVVTERGRKPVLQVTVPREGKRPLVATWGRTDLVRCTTATLNDAPSPVWNTRTELVERLLADTCELCGSREEVQVHHIRALKDLQRPGRRERSRWVQLMAARRRKTLVVCRSCHTAIHAGRPRSPNRHAESWRAG